MAVKFWKELRRRQMFRLVGLYIVGAWLVIQVADIVFPTWGIPDSAMRYMFFAAALCFPIALVFGWIFYSIYELLGLNGIPRQKEVAEVGRL